MIAELNKTYAQIVGGKIHWIFTHNELPEWNESQIQTVDVTSAVPSIGWQFLNGVFVQPDAPPPPTPIQQIRALEQAHEDDQRKLNRQGAIDTALTIACRNPAAAAMTRDQVHAAYYAGNRGYRAMVDLEAQCTALRKLIV